MATKQENMMKTIDAQQEQLSRYESRMKDLVRAYKSLNKEKEALEASLKALTSSKPQKANRNATKARDGKDGPESSKEKEDSAQGQLATVTASMQTLLKEKSRMETNFMADRKALKADLDKMQAELKEAHRALAEAKERLARAQQDRDEETKNYSDMIREAQDLLCRERDTVVQLQGRAAELEAELSQRQAGDSAARQLSESADTWRARVAELEQTLADREERARSLESHVAEVSASLGQYQQRAVADQAAVDRLKDQVARLEADARQQARLDSASPADCLITNDPAGDADLTKSVRHLAARLKELPPDPELVAPLRELIQDGDDIDWKQEYRQLKEEFEKYKVRVMAARKKDPSQACPSVSSELDALRRQTEELRLRLRKTCEDRDDLERTLRAQISRLEQNEADLRLSHRSELASLESAQRLRLTELDQQLANQRLRASALLEEREAELRSLRESQAGASPEAVAASLSQLGFSRHEGQMLHYMQEVARKDKEISNLRRTKHQLESSMRQLQNKMLEREEVLQDETERLRDQIRRLELNASREGANLEYVKNIVVRYMLSTDAAQKAHILNAIATALQFSKDELRRVRLCQTASWWPASSQR